MSNHWDTIEDELTERKQQVEMAIRDKHLVLPKWKERLARIDAALAFVREMRQQPTVPIPAEISDAIGYCWRWALACAEKHIDNEERYLFMDNEINKVVVWIESQSQDAPQEERK